MAAVALVCTGLLLYAWVGYPLLVRLFAVGRRPHLLESRQRIPFVSVVIATREASDAIADRVADLARTAYPATHLEVVISLDARRDAPVPAMPKTHFGVSIISGDLPGGKAAALNAGVRAAQGEIIVFTDTGQRFADDTIHRLATRLASDRHLGALSGALHLGGPGSTRLSPTAVYWRYERWLRRWEAQLHSAVGVTGAVYAMRREDWTPLPEGLILDDLYAPMKLVLRGYRIGFDRAALAYDTRSFAPTTEYRRKARTQTGVLQLCAWLRPVLDPRRNPIWIQFVSHKVLRLLTPYLLIGAVLCGSVAGLRSIDADLALRILGWSAVAATVPLILSRRAREAVWNVLLMQAAVIKASLNALQGDWDVWRN